MLKRSITYTNPFTDEQVTEEHHFHISKADLVEMEMEVHNAAYRAKDGRELTGMQAKLQRIIDAEDGAAIIAEMKDIIRRSYGVKEGDRFRKSEAIWEEFASSEAFSQLIFELCTDAEKTVEFTNGIIPSNLAQEAAEIARQSADISDAEEQQTETAPAIRAVEDLEDRVNGDTPAEPRVLTDVELREMDPIELKAGLADGRYTLS